MIDAAERIDRPAAPLRGRVSVPGSKSLSTRALVLAALAPAPVLLRNLLAAEDSLNLAKAIEAMGARVTRLLGDDWWIDGRDLRTAAESVRVHLGDGGAPARFAMALASRRAGPTTIDGSPRLRERPVDDGVKLLRALGAEVRYAETEGRLPVEVDGRAGMERPPGMLEVPRTASSQFVSALMLIAPSLAGGLRLRFVEAPTSASYLALTLEALRDFGATVAGRAREAGDELTIGAGFAAPREYSVPADASSAVVWVAAAAMVPGSRVEIEGLRRDAQPDLLAIDAIGRMGARLRWESSGLVVEHAPLRGLDADASDWPDGALAVAAAATAAQGTTRLRSLGTLRVKESDRLAALREEFTRLGAPLRVEGDDLVIEGASSTGAERLPAVEVESHRDHRIAMSAALVALRRGSVLVRDPGVVAKSYPRFWRHLERLAAPEAGV